MPCGARTFLERRAEAPARDLVSLRTPISREGSVATRSALGSAKGLAAGDQLRDLPAPLLDAVDRGLLLDATVEAWIKTAEPERAMAALLLLEPLSGRSPGDLCLALLRAHIAAAGREPDLAAR